MIDFSFPMGVFAMHRSQAGGQLLRRVGLWKARHGALVNASWPAGPYDRGFIENSVLLWEGEADFSLATVKQKFDSSTVEKELLGRQLKSYEEQVIDTVTWYVGLDD